MVKVFDPYIGEYIIVEEPLKVTCSNCRNDKTKGYRCTNCGSSEL